MIYFARFPFCITFACDSGDDGSRKPSGLRSAYRRFDSCRQCHITIKLPNLNSL